MSPRRRLWFSIGLNAALAGCLWWLWTSPHDATLPQRPAKVAPARSTQPASGSDLGQLNTAPEHPPTAAPFHWSQIASTNFARYRDDLRALGCPEQTVRDIIESEINVFFAQRRRPIIDALQPRFWEAIAQGEKEAFKSFENELDALRDERRALLAEVLGERPGGDDIALEDSRADWGREYAWLPPEQQAQLVRLEERRWRQSQALQREIGDRPWTAKDQARRRELDEAFTKARREALGEHLADFELRNAREAHWADGAASFEPTEAEWRAVTEALRQPPARGGGTDANPSSTKAAAEDAQRLAAEAAEATRRQALQTTLGPERYAEFERASSGNYQQTRRVTRRLGLTDDTAVQAWEIEREASAAAAELRRSAALDADRRRVALEEVHAEANRSLQQVLGADGLQVYRKYAGDWLGALTSGE